MWSQYARLLRAAVVSVVVLALSAGAHVIGGSGLPDPAIVLGLGALTMLAVTACARHALTLPALMGVLGCGQFVLHHAFGLLSTAATCVPASTHLHFGLGGHATLACSGPLEMHASGVAGRADAVMLAAHLVATLVMAAVITRGEESLHATSAWLRPILTLLQPAALPPLARIIVFVHEYRLRAAPFLVSPPLRGPPAFHWFSASIRTPRRPALPCAH